MTDEISTPEQLNKEALNAYEQEDFLKAARLFEAAAHGFSTAGEQALNCEMLNNSSVAYLKAGDAEKAYEIVKETPGLLEKAGDIRRQGMALGNTGAALEGLKRYDEAMHAYQQSSDLLKQCGEKEYRAHVMQSLSALQLKRGHQYEAIATMQSGLEVLEHPSLKQRLLKKLLRIPFDFLTKK
jgi:tetratricopeptide (TPR) repeat protein